MVMLREMLVERQRTGLRGPAGNDAAQIPEMFVRVMSPLLPGPAGAADRRALHWARSLSSWEALARLIRVLDVLQRVDARRPDRLAPNEWLRLHAGWCCCLAESFRLHLAAAGAELPEVALGATREDAAVAAALRELCKRSGPTSHSVTAHEFDEPIARVLRRLYDWSLGPAAAEARC